MTQQIYNTSNYSGSSPLPIAPHPTLSTLFSQTLSQIETTFTLITSSILPYPKKSVEQFNEMVMPRAVPGETNPKLIAKETAASIALTSKLSAVTSDEIGQFLKVMHILDLNPKLPHLALEALRRGLLDPQHGPMQVATLLNFWAALQYHQDPQQLTTVSVFAPEAEELIRETLRHSLNQEYEPFLKGDKFNLFLEKLKALPISEQRFLVVPDLQGDLTSPPEQPYNATVSQATKATGVNVFNRIVSKKLRMIASMGMMQAFLDAQYGDNAVKIKPRLYLSTACHIYETRQTDCNDMMFPTPLENGKSRCPEKADGFLAPWYDFPYHDFYHAICASAVGKTYRKIGVFTSNLIRLHAKTASPEDQKGLHQLAFSFLEMEYPGFHHFVPKALTVTPPVVFLLTIDAQIYHHIRRFENHQALEQEGFPLPFKMFPISKESQVGVLNRFINASPPNLETLQKAIDICKENPQDYHPLLELEETVVVQDFDDNDKDKRLPDWLEEILPRNCVEALPRNNDVMTANRYSDFLDRDDEDMDGFIT